MGGWVEGVGGAQAEWEGLGQGGRGSGRMGGAQAGCGPQVALLLLVVVTVVVVVVVG